MKILVADDDPVLRNIVTAGLKAGGHEIDACSNGAEAWEAIKANPYPVVVTDWLMPELDGLQLTQNIRKMARETYTYVIMLTGMTKRDDFLTGVKAGVDAFLLKPLDGAVLEAQVNIATRILGLQAHAKKLENLMTVCSYCKRVRDAGAWMPMEAYIAAKFRTLPSHTFCPDCFKVTVEPQLRELGISTEGMQGV
jgi:sigma-B regulation protein RsbU (phosphoserine phosphatase)